MDKVFEVKFGNKKWGLGFGYLRSTHIFPVPKECPNQEWEWGPCEVHKDSEDYQIYSFL